MDAELPPDPLSLTPEEKESAAAYLRTTFRLHPISSDESNPPPALAPASVQARERAVKFVILKKDDEDPLM